jgi:hypothetical protein
LPPLPPPPLHGSEPTMRSIVQPPSIRLDDENDDERSNDAEDTEADDAAAAPAPALALAPAPDIPATIAAISFGCQLRSAAASALTAASIGGHSIGTRRMARRSEPALTDCSVNQPSMDSDADEDAGEEDEESGAVDDNDDGEADEADDEEDTDAWAEDEAGKKLAGSCVRSNSSWPSRRSEKLDESSTKTDRICEASTGAAAEEAAVRTADDGEVAVAAEAA